MGWNFLRGLSVRLVMTRKHLLTNPLFTVHTVNKEFEWDERKCESTRRKHRVSFEEAVEAFDDSAAVLLLDVRHSTAHEEREILIGRVLHGIL
ncbi:MAG: BrnT family toxin, partial [Thaumarchaeota archaeon]|nr:BrnT family toxin [Nitrososphaerota archaeon]